MQQFYATGRVMPIKTDRTKQVTVYPPRHILNQNVFLQDPIKKICTTRTGSNTKPQTNLKTRRIEDSFKLASASVREVVDVSSKYPRDLFDTGSGAVREMFDCCSGASRRTTESHPKQYRSCPEPVPKRTRSAPEGHPNSTRRNRWRFSRFFDVHKAEIKYRCSKDVVLFTQLLHKIAVVPLMYRECTVGVQGVYRKGTGDLLRSYWRSTTDLLNACISGVDQRYSKSRRVVGVMRSRAIPLMAVWLCFSRKSFPVMALKNKGVLLYGLLCFMLFNLSTAWAQSAETRTAEGQISDTSGHRIIPYSTANLIDKVQKTGKYDLNLYPWESYEIDTSLVTKTKVGDSIPSSLLDLPLTIVGTDVPIDTITLNDLAKDKLLVIDFWTTWCAPCIGSMQKWEEIQEKLPDEVVLLGVHLDYAFKARPFIVDRDWKSYTSIGLNAYVLNRHFFYQDVISRVVFIKDGRFLTVGGTTGYDLSTVKRFISGDVSSIPARLEWTYAAERSSQ